MEQSLDLGEEDRLLGSWPRRLLHVPTMTSYEWEPGNKYGPVKSPRYNAITYTWGRWKLKSNELPHIKAIDIGGVDWEIPRIHPLRFDVDDFKNLVRRAIEPVSLTVRISSRQNATEHKSASTEYIWLDVACIDQRESEPRSAAEVGRQADIFKGAQNVFIWLTDFYFSELQSLLKKLNPLDPRGLMGDDFDPWIASNTHLDTANQVYIGLRQLFGDHWFSSLWTLQEVFLRQDGILVSREGKTVSNEFSKDDFNFLDILSMYDEMDIFGMKAAGHSLTGSLILLSNLSDQVGLTAIYTQSAMVALVASGNRTTTREEDRVYAIQQIFGLRLGNTNTKAAPGSTFTRAELEVQLGRELLQSYPVHSQTHVFTKPAKSGHGWRANGDSVIPSSVIAQGNPVFPHNPFYGLNGLSEEESAQIRQQIAQDLAPRCSLTVSKLEGATLGTFTGGKICPFATVVTQSRQFEQIPIVSHLFSGSNSLFLTYLDASSQFNACPVSPSSGFYDSYSKPRQRALADWLCCSYPCTNLVVLLLGPLESGERRDMYALLLLLDQGTTWKRIGFCQWAINVMTIAAEPLPGHAFFHGDTDDWVKCNGYFG